MARGDEGGNSPIFDKMAPEDVPVVLEIEKASTLSPWSETQFYDELKKDCAHCRVMRLAGVKGFFVFWMVGREAQIANMAVHPEARGQGWGERILNEQMTMARGLGAQLMTLEVREGNASARRLYEKAGFLKTSCRPGFYEGRETAVLMEKHLENCHHDET